MQESASGRVREAEKQWRNRGHLSGPHHFTKWEEKFWRPFLSSPLTTKSEQEETKPENFWLLLCNIQSLLYKLDELRVFATATKPTFICVTETWFTPDIDSDVIQNRGFECFRYDRRDDVNDHQRGDDCAIRAIYASLSARASACCTSSM